MLQKSKGIVLWAQRINEEQLVVRLFTESEGAVGFIQRVPRTARAAIRTNFFEPLTQLDIEWNHREQANLQRLRSARPNPLYHTIGRDPAKISVAMFLGEFLSHCLREEHTNPRLYAYLVSSLRLLDATRGSVANFHIVFLLNLAGYLGFAPNMTGREGAVCFDLLGSCYLRRLPNHSYYIYGDELKPIPVLTRLCYQTMHLLRLTRAQRQRLTEVLLQYYRLHVPGFGRLRSPEVLAALRE